MSNGRKLARFSLVFGALLVPVAALAGAGAHAWRAFGPPKSEAELRERLDHGAQRAFSATDATVEQQAAVGAVLDDAAASLWGRHAERQDRREAFRAVLTADEIDRVALEVLRKEVVATFDEVSFDVVGYVADVAEIFSAEQRRALAALHDETHPAVE